MLSRLQFCTRQKSSTRVVVIDFVRMPDLTLCNIAGLWQMLIATKCDLAVTYLLNFAISLQPMCQGPQLESWLLLEDAFPRHSALMTLSPCSSQVLALHNTGLYA